MRWIFNPLTRLLLLTLLLSNAYVAYAQVATQDVKLNSATVFLQGAELVSSVELTLAAGENEILLGHIANNINEQSLLVSASNGVLVKSFSVKKNYLSDQQLSPLAAKLTEQIIAEQRNKQLLASRLQVIDAQLKILEENQAVKSSDLDSKVESVDKMLTLVGNKMEGYLIQRIDLDGQIEAVSEQLTKLEKQLKEEQQKSGALVNQIALKLYAEKALTTQVQLSYVISQASWRPTYDILVDKINAPINLIYKANVVQYSGIDWDNVRLTLSTGNPNQGAQAPQLLPEYLTIYQEKQYSISKTAMVEAPMASSDEAMDDINSITQARYTKTNTHGVNTHFEITLPYSIASDGKAHIVLVKQAQLTGEYRYVAIPKRDNDAFLQVQVADWAKLNLLSAKSNIFFEGSFVGQGYIDTRNVGEVMNLSLGRDKKIILQRENDASLKSEPTFLGNNITQHYAYSIQVRNTRSEAIKLVIIDQVPVSQDSAISVVEVKYSGAEYNKANGALKWTLTVAPDSLVQLPFSYSVKYPKDKQVINL